MAIDITKPHIGRIYDYVLGGTHNFEADRRAAQEILALAPSYPRTARENRAFLAHVGRVWAAEGRTQVLDLGSGLPTQGHFNSCMPAAKILFSDVDPLTVAQARQTLAYSPDMAYLEVDLRDPEPLFAQAEEFFGSERVLAVGCIGIVYLLSDEHVRRLMERLHAFCAPGSVLALSSTTAHDGVVGSDRARLLREVSQFARIELFPRTPEQLAEVVAPWRITGSQPLADASPQDAPAVRSDHPLDQFVLFGSFAVHD